MAALISAAGNGDGVRHEHQSDNCSFLAIERLRPDSPCPNSESLVDRQHPNENPVAMKCEHLRDLTAADFPPPRTPGTCEECLKEGTRWVELRECQPCGHLGCCDSSPGKHATKHFHEAGHPVMRSARPGAAWTWCYVHEAEACLGEDASDS